LDEPRISVIISARASPASNRPSQAATTMSPPTPGACSTSWSKGRVRAPPPTSGHRQQPRQAARQHRLPRPTGTNQRDRVPARPRDLERALARLAECIRARVVARVVAIADRLRQIHDELPPSPNRDTPWAGPHGLWALVAGKPGRWSESTTRVSAASDAVASPAGGARGPRGTGS
jgi:hypothetical protein